MKKKIVLVAGARPNFMKIAPIIGQIKIAIDAGAQVTYSLVHTGQHYDASMSQQFFDQLNIPQPDINLGAGGGTQAEQTASVMIGFEKYIGEEKPDLIIVVGDVTSTLACSIVAKKACVAVAHVEGGIRSGDMTMPEEINRMVTDSIADYFFTTSNVANDHLRREGKLLSQIFFVGNTMIDTLLSNLSRLKKPALWDEAGLKNEKYFVMTLHRPANVDDPVQLGALCKEIGSGAEGLPVVFPVHPRTRKNISQSGLKLDNIILTDPLGYLEFNFLVKNAKGVVTDSGGITEETTVLGIPCMTLRKTTERPETCTEGTNELIGTDAAAIRPAMHRIIQGQWKKGSIPELWDGRAAERIVDIITKKILK